MKYIIRLLKNLGFRWKIMLSFIIIILLPLIFAAGYVYNNSVKSIENQSMSSLQDILKSKRIEIDQKLDNYENIARNIAVNPIIASYIDNVELSDIEKTDITYKYLTPFFDWIKRFNSDDFDVKVFTNNSNLFECENIYHFDEIQGKNFFSRVLSATYADPYWDTLHKPRVYKFSANVKPKTECEVSIFIPLMSVYDNSKSFLNINLASEAIFKNLSDSVIFKDGYMFVLDAEGDIVLDIGSSTGLFKKNIKKWILTMNKEKCTEDSVANIDREVYVVNRQDISKLKCSIISVYPMKKVMQAAKQKRNVFILIFTAGGTLLLIFSYVFSRSLMKNIKALVKVMRRVQEGDLTTKVIVNGMDEIGELGQDFNIMLDRINQLIESVYKSEILQKDALLLALQSQINPHFLYNVLETIKMMAEIDRNVQISDAVTSLGSLVRYNLSNSNEFVPIFDEIKQIESYCCLQNLMINNRLNLNIVLEDFVLKSKILKLMLQPIVENSIIHGFSNYDGVCDITISGYFYSSGVAIDIIDNGKGMNKERLMQLRDWIYARDENKQFVISGSGIGLRNVHQRIQLKYGEEYGLTIESTPENGTKVTVSIPAVD